MENDFVLGSKFSDNGDDDDDDDDDDDYHEEDTSSNIPTWRTLDAFTVPEPLTDRVNPPTSVRSTEDGEEDDELTMRQVARFECETDEDIGISSEEESDIIREIKAEITNKVKLEMADELSVPMELTLHSRSDPATQTNGKEKTDPKLKAAILKMRKLDRILEKKFAEEKEVKRNHIAVKLELCEKLDQLNKENGRCMSTDEHKNTEAFLALTYPTTPLDPSICSQNHSRSTANDCDYAYRDDDESITPIFPTQPPFEFGRISNTSFGCEGVNSMTSINGNGIHKAPTSSAAKFLPDSATSGRGARRNNRSANGVESAIERSTSADGSTRGGSKLRNKGSNRGRRNTDFIQRNIQLATEAGAVMTGDERKRLDELLCDLETVPEMLANENNNEDSTKTVVEFRENNAGYMFGTYERQRMDDIDDRLKALLPAEDYMMVRSVTPSRGLPLAKRRGSGDTQTSYGSDEDKTDGDKDLRFSEDDDRDLGARLRDVDDRLSRLATVEEQEEGYTPPLSRVRLQALLDDCARTNSRLSRISQGPDDESGTSSSRTVLEHPRLDEEVLKRLLADARKTPLSARDDTNQSNGIDRNESKPEVGRINGAQDAKLREKFYSNNYDVNSAWRLLSDRDDKNASPSRSASITQRTVTQQQPPPRSNSATLGSVRTQGGERSVERTSDEFVRRPFLPEINPSGTLTSAVRRSFSQGRLNFEGENPRVASSLALESSPRAGGVTRVWNSLKSDRDHESRLEK